MTYPDPYYGNTPGTSYYGASGGSNMAIDPLSAVAAGGQALSSIFGQQGPTQVDKNLSREGLNKQGAPIAADLSRKLALMPLADRAAFLISQRLQPGVMSGQNFQPHDIFNPGASAATPQYSGINQGALAEANKGYTSGAGGFDPHVIQQALANLGSSHDQSYSTNAGGYDPLQTAGQIETAQDAAKKKKSVLGPVGTFAHTGTSGFAPGGING